MNSIEELAELRAWSPFDPLRRRSGPAACVPAAIGYRIKFSGVTNVVQGWAEGFSPAHTIAIVLACMLNLGVVDRPPAKQSRPRTPRRSVTA